VHRAIVKKKLGVKTPPAEPPAYLHGKNSENSYCCSGMDMNSLAYEKPIAPSAIRKPLSSVRTLGEYVMG